MIALSNRFLSLACTNCGRAYPLDTHSRCTTCKNLLDARYDLEPGFELPQKRKSMWDFAEFFPPLRKESIVSLGEGWTTHIDAPRYAARVGARSVLFKVEGSNPSGSFKDRGASLGVSLARDWGKDGVFSASDGNAASAVSAYSARAGMRSLVLMSEGVPSSKLAQALMYSPNLLRVSDLYASLQALETSLATVQKALPTWMNLFVWVPYNPLLVDAFKTIAYEIALSGEVPDIVFVPVAGGDLLYGLYKGFAELKRMGRLVESPRLVAVQGEGADPTVRAIERGLERVEETGPPNTVAGALRVNFGSENSIRAVRVTGGFGISVSDEQILTAQKQIARDEGIFCETSSATAPAAISKAIETGMVSKDQKIAAILTGFGLKDFAAQADPSRIPLVVGPSELPAALERISRDQS